MTASEMRGILSDEAIMSTPALQNLRAKCRHDEQTLDTVNFFKLKDALVLNEEKAQHVREKKKKFECRRIYITSEKLVYFMCFEHKQTKVRSAIIVSQQLTVFMLNKSAHL